MRLPKEAEFPSTVTEVDIVSRGPVRMLIPKQMTFKEWFETGGRLSEDFSVEPRNWGEEKERDFPWK